MTRVGAASLVLSVCLMAGACSEEGTSDPDGGHLPSELPFVLERPDVGEPLSQAEISQFTAKITGLWRDVDYFTWVLETCHGMDASTAYPDYLIWWHDVDAVKEGDTVTFRNNSQYGGSHNNAKPTALVLSQAGQRCSGLR